MSEREEVRPVANPHKDSLNQSSRRDETRNLFNSIVSSKANSAKHERTLVLLLYWQTSNIDVKPEVSTAS